MTSNELKHEGKKQDKSKKLLKLIVAPAEFLRLSTGPLVYIIYRSVSKTGSLHLAL